MTAPCHRCSPRTSATTPTRPMRTSRLPSLLALLLALSACAAPAATTPGSTPTVGLPGGGTVSPRPDRVGRTGRLADPERRTERVAGERDDIHGPARRQPVEHRAGVSDVVPAAPGLERGPLSVARDEPGHHRARMGPDRQRRPGRHPDPGRRRPPPPSGSGCTANQRVSAGSAQTFRTIPDAGAGVALTFDMGGRMDPAVDIMNFLVDHDVCATIFATGVMSETDEGRQVMAIIRDNPQLFEIANHTMYHCDLARGGGGSPTTRPLHRDIRRRPDPDRAHRCGGDPPGRHGPEPAAVLAPAVRVAQPGGHRRRGRGRLHEDVPLGRRHDRLEADQPGWANRRADRGQGDQQLGERLERPLPPRRLRDARRPRSSSCPAFATAASR